VNENTTTQSVVPRDGSSVLTAVMGVVMGSDGRQFLGDRL